MRALVVSASMGAGHDAAAAELVRRLQERDCEARRVDVLELGAPGQGARLRRTYALLLDWLPYVYDASIRMWARWPAPLERLTALGADAYERGLLREVQAFDADVVVSVYNLASQCLGRLRARGELGVPVVTYATDPGPHPYWVHRGVDAHITALPVTAAGLAACGAPGVAATGPLVRPCFRAADDAARRAARRVLGVPQDATVALVTAGSWAAGDVLHTVELLARSGRVLPLTLCGRDAGLRRRLARGPGLALGWTDDVPAVMAASDVLVDNAGGMTCFEALASCLPVVVFHPLPGHGRLNAEALERAQVARYVRSGRDLAPAVTALAGHSFERACQVSRARAMLAGDPTEWILDAARTAALR